MAEEGELTTVEMLQAFFEDRQLWEKELPLIKAPLKHKLRSAKTPCLE